MNMPNGSWLYADGSRGIYIPQMFTQSVKRECVAGVSAEDWAALEAGPEHDLYWDTWDWILDRAELTDPTSGQVFTLYQDGDLWCIPKGAEWNDSDD